MSSKILVTYATTSGSTAEMAQTLGEQLTNNGASVEVKPIAQAGSLDDYDAFVVGGPMIMGWHREATNFVQNNAAALASKPVAYFFTSLNLTRPVHTSDEPTSFYIDPQHGTDPKNANALNFMEKHTLPENYLKPVLEKAPQARPVSVAFFGGKLDYSTLKLPAKLFVKFLIRGKEGDRRNWDAVREWAGQLNDALKKD